MKTAEQIVEENFKGLDDLIEDKELVHFYKGVIKECLKGFAEQFVNLAADKAEEKSYMPFISATDMKYSILELKELIK